MKTVFVDTSAFYALLDSTDPVHEKIAAAFMQAAKGKLALGYHELRRP
jgi:predicted nucleic acid-binding protein